MDKLITINNLSYIRNGKKILNGISFNITKGDKIALLGNNGAGKTTLIDIITQDIKPTEGEVCYGYTSIFPKGEIGVLYGCLPLLPYLRVYEQIKYYAAIYKRNYKNIKETYYKQLGIDKIQNSFIYQLSQGERQKLGLLISIINNPGILIWDEPFSNLDPTIIDTFWNIVNTDDKTIFYSTHNWEDAINKSTKVCLLYEGQLLEGPVSPTELLLNFPKQNILVVGIDDSISTALKDYEYYELDGCYYILWSPSDSIISDISNFTNNFSVKKISLVDYYRYKTSKMRKL